MTGTLVFVGGGEFRPGLEALDAELLAARPEVVVIPTAAAYERPEHKVEAATRYFEALGATVVALDVVHRHDVEHVDLAPVRDAGFVYLTDGSPLHLRSVLKESALYDAIVAAHAGGAVVAASGAGATVLGDPMVDPRGGAYTVGLALVANLAVFPYHGSAAAHLWDRSKDLLPPSATLVGIDEETALVRDPDGSWRVAGAGRVTVHRRGADDEVVAAPGGIPDLAPR